MARVHIGGLFRCCTENLSAHVEQAEADGLTSLVCPHCHSETIRQDDGVWRWHGLSTNEEDQNR